MLSRFPVFPCVLCFFCQTIHPRHASTTHVVASSVVGAGAGESWRRVRWSVVNEMLLAWILTLPATAALGAAFFFVWKGVT